MRWRKGVERQKTVIMMRLTKVKQARALRHQLRMVESGMPLKRR